MTDSENESILFLGTKHNEKTPSERKVAMKKNKAEQVTPAFSPDKKSKGTDASKTKESKEPVMKHVGNQPDSKLYSFGSEMRFGKAPYKESGEVVGINLAPRTTLPNVRVGITEDFDLVQFNEPKNRYGQFIVKKMIKILRDKHEKKKGSRLERDAFVAVMKEHLPPLMDMSGYVVESINNHIVTAAWKIQCAFNSDSEFNESLEMMLVYYASV